MGRFFKRGGGLLKKGRGCFRSLWRSFRSSTPSRRPSLCLPNFSRQLYLRAFLLTTAAKIITKKLFTKKTFWCNYLGKRHKIITLQSKFLGLQEGTRGSNITKKIFRWNYFCNNYKDYYKRQSSNDLWCNNFGQNGTSGALLLTIGACLLTVGAFFSYSGGGAWI